MKKMLCLFISISVMSILVVSTVAQDIPQDISIKVVRSNGKVKLTGNMVQGPWKEVTAIVVNPTGGIEYIGQTTSGSEGSFDFRYTMKDKPQEGKYILYIGGSYTNEPLKTYFDFTAQGEVQNVQISYTTDSF